MVEKAIIGDSIEKSILLDRNFIIKQNLDSQGVENCKSCVLICSLYFIIKN